MVRLKDIAACAGVSVMTVSKSLREAPDVSDSTRARIRLMASQMGYMPDSSAQGLRTKTTKLFGLIVPAMTDPVFSRIVLAIEEHAHELGYDLLLAHSLNKVEREEACIRRMLSRRVDGLFVSPVYRMEPEARIYQELLTRKVPTILLGAPAQFCSQFASMQVDDIAASQAATRHLLELGHEHIAFLTGPLAAPWAQARYEGYQRGLREAGRQVDEKMVFQAGSTIEDGTKAALQMMNENCAATAVQAVNDLVAIGCANTFLNQGIRIPHDRSIMGFGNILTAEYFRVPLTTVRQPKFRLGVAAVEAMRQLLRGERVALPPRHPAELILRASTAPAKK